MHASVLRYIDQVARSGSIRRAAIELNVAASAVNRQILNLEAELGCALFERLSSGVKPTPAGEILLSHVRRTLTDWRTATGGISALTDEISGEVRIVALPPLIVSILLSVVGKLTDDYEKISFIVLASDGAKSAEQMKIGYPDIALLPYDKRYNNYEIVDTLEMKLGAVVSAEHPLATRQTINFTEAAEHPAFLLYDNWVRDHSENEFRFTGAKFNPRVQANSWTFVREMIRIGKGVGFLTPIGIMDQLESGELKFIPVELPEDRNSKLSIFVHRDRHQSSEVIVAVDEIKDRFQRVRELMVRLEHGG